MRMYILAIVLFFLFPALLGASPLIILSGRPPVAGGGGAEFSDDFLRGDSDSLGANWTEAAGDADIASNAYRVSTGGFANVISVYSGEACNTVNEYVKITLGADAQYPAIILRYTNSSSAFYLFFIEGTSGIIDWYKFANTGDSGTAIGSSIDISAGAVQAHTIGMTITGTGANTDIRVWLDPTGLPTAADNWNGDTTPNGSWLTTDPGANAVDTGNTVGIGGTQGTADLTTIDDFFGGDVP